MTDQAGSCCDDHVWWWTDEIGELNHTFTQVSKVRWRAAELDFWETAKVDHDDLLQMVEEAGGITCENAIQAVRKNSGEIVITWGLQLWSIAKELGIQTMPVYVRPIVEASFTGFREYRSLPLRYTEG